MRRAADTANGREQRIKAKLQEARPLAHCAASFADATRLIADAQVHDAYKKVRHMRSAAAHVVRWRRVRAADASPRAQAKNKSAQLQEAVTAASNDRDELQKKYEAKSRYVRAAAVPCPCSRSSHAHVCRAQREAPDGRHAQQAALREPGAPSHGTPLRIAFAALTREQRLHHQSLKALRGGVPSSMQPSSSAHQQQHDAVMAHGAAQALLSGGFGGNGGGSGLPVMRAASLHQQHQYTAGMGGGGEAMVTHTRSIHAAVLPQRFDGGGGGGVMSTPGRGNGGGTPAQQRSFGGGGFGASVHAAQPAGACACAASALLLRVLVVCSSRC